ncbi:MAG: MATE family efflux transporter [Proteobacteria bacterium]|nr:MATE family efflux transporter [Pseudomonadota bacterium]
MVAVTPPKNKLLEGPILRSLLSLAIPIVAANTLQSGYQLIDAFWVGRLGGAAVAAVSLSFPVMFLMFAVGAGLSIAGSTLIAQFVGAGNHKMVGHVAGQTLLMVIASALVLTVGGLLAAPALLRLMGVPPDVYDGALGFMRVSFVGLVFNFSFFVFNAIMRSIGRATLPVYIVLGTVCLNFVLDPLLIFGWGPVPAYGVMGAALATLFTQAIAAAIGIAVLRRGLHGIHVKRADLIPDLGHVKRAFFLGFPASVDMSARALGLMLMTFLVTSFGTTTLAAYGVGGTILQVIIIPAMGLSMAVSALAGQNIGAGNLDRAAAIGRLGAALGFGVLTVLGVLVFLFPTQLVSFFVPDDKAVIAEATTFLRIMALSWGFIGAQFALTGVFRASGNMVVNMMLTIVTLWVLQFPLAYVLSKHTSLGAEGIYWSTPVANILITLVAAAIYLHGGWRKKRLLDDEEVLTGKVSEEILSSESPR